jgi:hypothetical protein
MVPAWPSVVNRGLLRFHCATLNQQSQHLRASVTLRPKGQICVDLEQCWQYSGAAAPSCGPSIGDLPMTRTGCLRAALCLLLSLPLVITAQQHSRPQSPRLSNDDLPPSGSAQPGELETITGLNGNTGTPVHNPLAVLRNSLTRMGTINSLRTHLQFSSTEGTREIIAEMIKPDRMRVTAPDAEVVVIGQTYYVRKPGEDWQVASSKSSLNMSVSALDYAQFLNKMLTTPGISVTGRAMGDEVVDGYTTVAYEFTITDGNQKGTIETAVGKDDGFLRRLFMYAPSMTLKAWFTGINEGFKIERPQI